MTRISLVRHGLVDNPGRVYYGRLPGFGLADEGRQQAAAAGSYLADRAVVAVYHSPLLRAFQTACIVNARLATPVPLIECALLNEIYSPYDGETHAEMTRRKWDFYHELSPPYEEPDDILARLLAFFEMICRRHAGQHVVGVSHADPIAFAIQWAHGLSLSPEGRRHLQSCGVSDAYPAPASITTFTFADGTERELTGCSYHNASSGA